MKAKFWSGILCSCTFLIAQTQPPPPAQQPPTPTPSAPATPTAPKPTIQREETPAAPQASPDRDTGGDAISIEPFYWMNNKQPTLSKAHGSTASFPGALDFPGHAKFAIGAVVTIPTGKENSLQATYFRMQSSAFPTLGQDSVFEGNGFPAGEYLHLNYKLQVTKVSWNYLTLPYPSNRAKFRIKTLWEVQYINVNGLIVAPYDFNTTASNLTKNTILPTLGVGIEYHPSKHIRLELKGSGFGIPHHADIWDTEASAVIRTRRLELLIGGRAYHFKTTPQTNDNFFTQTLWGPYAGLRFIWR